MIILLSSPRLAFFLEIESHIRGSNLVSRNVTIQETDQHSLCLGLLQISSKQNKTMMPQLLIARS